MEYNKGDMQISYKYILENYLDVVFIYDLEGRILDANDAALKKIGYTREKIINGKLSFKDFINGEELVKAVKTVEVMKKTGKFSGVNTYRIKKEKSGFIYLEIFGIPLRKDNKICAILGIGHDVTQLKEAEKKIIESEEKYRHLFENSPFSIALFDLKGKVVDLNTTLENFSGYKKNELLGKHFLELGLFRPEMVPILRERLNLYVSGEKLPPIELELYRKDGTLACLNPNVSLRKIGDETFILIIFEDITARKIAEKKIIESEEKYRKAYERENFYKDLFAHDMNNILQSMLFSLEFCELNLIKAGDQEDNYKLLKEIVKQVKRGASLVSNVRKFSEFEAAQLNLETKDVKQVIEEAMKIAETVAEGKTVNISLEEFKGNSIVQANAFLIDVFENILINAVKHNEKQTIKITIKLSKVQEGDKRALRIEFIDNANGISDVKKSTIFNRGYKGESSTGGMGLGLSLVKSILESYNASISVENRVQNDYSKGSIFILTFPLESY